MDYTFDENKTDDFSNYGIGDDIGEPKKHFDFGGFIKKYSKYFYLALALIVVAIFVYFLFFANRAEISIYIDNSIVKSSYTTVLIYKNNDLYKTVTAGDLINLKYGSYKLEIDGLSGAHYVPLDKKNIEVDSSSTGNTYTLYVYPEWISDISSFSVKTPEIVYAGGLLELTANITYTGSTGDITLLGTGDLEGVLSYNGELVKGDNSFIIPVSLPASKKSISGKVYIKETSKDDSQYSKSISVSLKTPPSVQIFNLKSFGSLSAGKTMDIDLVVKNKSATEEVKDVKIELISVDGLADSTLQLGDIKGWFTLPELFSISPGDQANKKITLSLPIDAPIAKLTFNFKITNNFLNNPLTSEVDIKQADIEVEGQVNLGTIKAGQVVNQIINVKNNTDYGATLDMAIENISLLNNQDGESWIVLVDKEKTVAGNDQTTFNIQFKPIITAKTDRGSFTLRLSNEFFTKDIVFEFQIDEVDFGFDIILDDTINLTQDATSRYVKSGFVKVKNTGSVDFSVDDIYLDSVCKAGATINLPEDRLVAAKTEKEYTFKMTMTVAGEKSCFMYVEYIDPLTGEKTSKSKAFFMKAQ